MLGCYVYVIRWKWGTHMSRVGLLGTASTLALLTGMSAVNAADIVRPPPVILPPATTPPAVSQVNAKVGAFGGTIDNVSGWGVAGALSLPLQRQWGLQVDALAGTGGGASFWGAGGHLFWRNPTRGLFGLYASWVDWSPVGATVSKIGVEGELYRGPFSLEGVLAFQGGTFSGIAGSATAAFYAGDNLRLEGNYRFLQGVGHIGGVGVEFQPKFNGRPSALALFANADWGQSGYQTIIGGIKLYAGPQKDLIRRHREDDPSWLLPWDLHVLPPVVIPCIGDATICGPPVLTD
jgi:hypothetical protein